MLADVLMVRAPFSLAFLFCQGWQEQKEIIRTKSSQLRAISKFSFVGRVPRSGNDGVRSRKEKALEATAIKNKLLRTLLDGRRINKRKNSFPLWVAGGLAALYHEPNQNAGAGTR